MVPANQTVATILIEVVSAFVAMA